jgi:hypothetical protein
VDRPRCKLCGKAHWSYEPHDLGPVTPSVTSPDDLGQPVTSHVTRELKQAQVLTEPHVCPLCGWKHCRPKYRSNADRQRAYRERYANQD